MVTSEDANPMMPLPPTMQDPQHSTMTPQIKPLIEEGGRGLAQLSLNSLLEGKGGTRPIP